jgi:CBS domain containing-hemolysin-like protein
MSRRPADPAEMEDANRRPEADAPSVAQTFADWLRGLAGRSTESERRENLAELLGEEGKVLENLAPGERLILLNVLKLGEVRVGDVMIPRADIVAVNEEIQLTELIKVFREGVHSRLPVYRANLDEVLGVVHIKDVFEFWDRAKRFNLRRIVREVLFVPASMLVVDLLLKMRLTRVHMAVVVDEYGGTDGLVTIEDLVEEIVGEIEGEHARAHGPMFTVRTDGSILAQGRAPVAELEERLGVPLVPEEREEDIETIGGLLVSLAGRVPLRGELIAHPTGLEFEVLDSDPRRVKRVRISGVGKLTKPAPGAEESTAPHE